MINQSINSVYLSPVLFAVLKPTSVFCTYGSLAPPPSPALFLHASSKVVHFPAKMALQQKQKQWALYYHYFYYYSPYLCRGIKNDTISKYASSSPTSSWFPESSWPDTSEWDIDYGMIPEFADTFPVDHHDDDAAFVAAAAAFASESVANLKQDMKQQQQQQQQQQKQKPKKKQKTIQQKQFQNTNEKCTSFRVCFNLMENIQPQNIALTLQNGNMISMVAETKTGDLANDQNPNQCCEHILHKISLPDDCVQSVAGIKAYLKKNVLEITVAKVDDSTLYASDDCDNDNNGNYTNTCFIIPVEEYPP